MSDHIFISQFAPSPKKRSTGENRTGLYEFECNACGHRFEDFVKYSEVDDIPCEDCGCDTRLVLSFSTNREEQNRYPYFDRGLGIEFRSKEHRRQVCAERGVEPIEGDTDFGDPFGVKAARREEEEEIKAADDYMDQIENDPAMAAYRQARDNGQFDHVYKRDQQ